MPVLRLYLRGLKKTVIERDTDLLTKEEILQHKAEVEAAILKELEGFSETEVRRIMRDNARFITTPRPASKAA